MKHFVHPLSDRVSACGRFCRFAEDRTSVASDAECKTCRNSRLGRLNRYKEQREANR